MKPIIFCFDWQELNWACQPVGRPLHLEGEAWSIYRASIHLMNGTISRKDGLSFDWDEFWWCCTDEEGREMLVRNGKAVPVREMKE